MDFAFFKRIHLILVQFGALILLNQWCFHSSWLTAVIDSHMDVSSVVISTSD